MVGRAGAAYPLVLAGVAALALAACRSPANTKPERLGPEERRASAAAGFELPPLFRARDIVPAELLAGPYHALDEEVHTDATTRVYTLRSDFGTFQVRGDDMLRIRVHEIDALAAMREMSATKEFAVAVANALKSPFVATWNLVTHPVSSIIGVPKGAWEAVREASTLAREKRGELEDSGFKELIGFEAKKRQIAAALGVDPYSSNEALQRELNRFAWAAYAGGLPSMFVPFSAERHDAAGGDEGDREEWIRTVLRSYSPEDLARLNRIELAVMGVPRPLCDAFVRHPWYSPHHETILVRSLSALDLVRDRRIFIEIASTAKSEEEAFFYQRAAELMRAYSENAEKIERIVAVDGTPAGYTEAGTLVVPFPADYAVWSPSTAAFAESLIRGVPADLEVRRTELLLTGTLSPRARAEIESMGIAVTERAFERLAPPPSGPDPQASAKRAQRADGERSGVDRASPGPGPQDLK